MNRSPAFLGLAPRLPTPHARPLHRTPVCMGRRSAKIANRKEKQTRARTKVFARIGKRITIAAKAGGADVETNRPLAAALDEARLANFPKDTMERAIARATNADQADFRESSFEVYGHAGVGIFVAVLTDNVNRAAADIRTVVTRNGLKVASPGSVAFNFERKGVVRVPKEAVEDEDELLLAAVEAGADECEPDPADEGMFRIVVGAAGVAEARRSLKEAGYAAESAEMEMVPKAMVEVAEEDAELNYKAIELLEDLDDVDGVYCNMAI